jgi:hypothetical protein
MSAISVTEDPYHISKAPRKTHATYPLVSARILSSLVPSSKWSRHATSHTTHLMHLERHIQIIPWFLLEFFRLLYRLLHGVAVNMSCVAAGKNQYCTSNAPRKTHAIYSLVTARILTRFV